MYPFELVFLCFLGKYLVVCFLGRRVTLFLIYRTSTLFSTATAPVCVPTNSAQGSPFSAASPTLVFCVVDFSHSDRCEVTAHRGSDVYFPDAE